MKSVWTKVSAVALVGVIIANAFIPYATALDIAPPVEGEEQGVLTSEFFTVENSVLDFGRVTELGRSYTKPITVKNNTGKDVIVDTSVSAYEEVGTENQKLSGWIAFVGGITHYNVADQNSRDISVRVMVPADAPAGTQYANVDLVDANSHKETVLVKIDIAGDDLKYASEVADAQIDPVRLDDLLSGRVTVKNTGTAGFSSTYQIRAKNMLGGMDWVIIKQASEEVFPGKQVEFTTSDQLGFGIYSVEQRVTFANEEGRMVESLLSRTVINLPWWSLAIAGGVLVLIILIVIVAKRRKHSKKNEAKLRRAERKARKAEIARVEHAEEKALENDDEEEVASEDEELDAVEAFSEDVEEADEIGQIAKKLDDIENDEPEEGEVYEDEDEAVPIKVTIKKSSKK